MSNTRSSRREVELAIRGFESILKARKRYEESNNVKDIVGKFTDGLNTILDKSKSVYRKVAGDKADKDIRNIESKSGVKDTVKSRFNRARKATAKEYSKALRDYNKHGMRAALSNRFTALKDGAVTTLSDAQANERGVFGIGNKIKQISENRRKSKEETKELKKRRKEQLKSKLDPNKIVYYSDNTINIKETLKGLKDKKDRDAFFIMMKKRADSRNSFFGSLTATNWEEEAMYDYLEDYTLEDLIQIGDSDDELKQDRRRDDGWFKSRKKRGKLERKLNFGSYAPSKAAGIKSYLRRKFSRDKEMKEERARIKAAARKDRFKKKGIGGKLMMLLTGALMFATKSSLKGIFWIVKKATIGLGKLLWMGVGKLVTGMGKLLWKVAGSMVSGLGKILTAGFSSLKTAFLTSRVGGGIKKGISKLGKKLGGFGTGIGKAFGFAKTGLAFIGGGSVLTGVLAVAAIGIAAWGAYKLYKNWKKGRPGFPNTPAGDVSYMRMMSYGLTKEQADRYKVIFDVEEVSHALAYMDNDGNVKFNEPSGKVEQQLLKIFGISNDSHPQFIGVVSEWLSKRFNPAYAEWLRVTWNIKNKIKPGEIGSLSDREISEIAYNFEPPYEVWDVNYLPFSDLPETEMTREAYEKYRNTVKAKLAKEWEVREKEISETRAAVDKIMSDAAKDRRLTNKEIDKLLESKQIDEETANRLRSENNDGPKISVDPDTGRIRLATGSSRRNSLGGSNYDIVSNDSSIEYSEVVSLGSGKLDAGDTKIVKGSGSNATINQTGKQFRAFESGGSDLISIDEAIRIASRSTGMDENMLWSMAKIESSLDPEASNPSGASGLMQFLKSTWNEMVDKYGAKYGLDRNNADPYNPLHSALMGAEYAKQNMRGFNRRWSQLGIKPEMAVYLAHHLGPAGFNRFVDAYLNEPNISMADFYRRYLKMKNYVRKNSDGTVTDTGMPAPVYFNKSTMLGKSVGQFLEYHVNNYEKKTSLPKEKYKGYLPYQRKVEAEIKKNGGIKDNVNYSDTPLSVPKSPERSTVSGVTMGGSIFGDSINITDGDFKINTGGDSGINFPGTNIPDSKVTEAANNANASVSNLDGNGLGASSSIPEVGGSTIVSPHKYTHSKSSNCSSQAYPNPNALKAFPIAPGYGYVFTDVVRYRGKRSDGSLRFHKGIDVTSRPINGPNRHNTPIVAAADGKVAIAGPVGCLGMAVMIDHPDLGIQTRYAHMRKGSLKVRVGEHVKAGQVLGIMGQTAYGNNCGTTGVHLHFEVIKGTGNYGTGLKCIDPLAYTVIRNGYFTGKKFGGILTKDGKFLEIDQATGRPTNGEEIDMNTPVEDMGMSSDEYGVGSSDGSPEMGDSPTSPMGGGGGSSLDPLNGDGGMAFDLRRDGVMKQDSLGNSMLEDTSENYDAGSGDSSPDTGGVHAPHDPSPTPMYSNESNTTPNDSTMVELTTEGNSLLKELAEINKRSLEIQQKLLESVSNISSPTEGAAPSSDNEPRNDNPARLTGDLFRNKNNSNNIYSVGRERVKGWGSGGISG